MRKFLTLAFIISLLLLAVPAEAQYPADLQGDQLDLPPGVVLNAGALLLDYGFPWSVPDIRGMMMLGQLGANQGQADISFQYLYNADGSYNGLAPLFWRQGVMLPWNEQLGCYALLTERPGEPFGEAHDFIALTVHVGSARGELRIGTFRFTGHPPVWYDYGEGDPYQFFEVAQALEFGLTAPRFPIPWDMREQEHEQNVE